MSQLIASWNVNSVNVRVEQVLDWLASNDIHTLALQEIKCLDENFPFDPFFEAGFEIVVSGQKTYNGVAILSRDEIDDVITDIPGFSDPQRRLLAATIGDIRLYDVYVPNGQSLDSDKYEYKLAWLKAFIEFVKAEQAVFDKQLILGDFNIAPDERDVHDVEKWHDCVLVSALERQALQQLLNLGFSDSFRLFEQPDGLFSWWDYRAGQFNKNQGLRIDLLLLSDALKARCKASRIDKTPRSWPRPSDHAPVLVELW